MRLKLPKVTPLYNFGYNSGSKNDSPLIFLLNILRAISYQPTKNERARRIGSGTVNSQKSDQKSSIYKKIFISTTRMARKSGQPGTDSRQNSAPRAKNPNKKGLFFAELQGFEVFRLPSYPTPRYAYIWGLFSNEGYFRISLYRKMGFYFQMPTLNFTDKYGPKVWALSR